MEIKEHLTLKDFKVLQKLEEQYYGLEYITPAQETYEWYEYNPDSIRVAVEEREIIGFCNFFPIKQEIYHLIEQGLFNDSELTYESLLKFEEELGEFNLFLSCIVVDKKWRGKGVTHFLLEAYLTYFEECINKGAVIKEIITDNVTREGEQFSRKIGLTFKRDSNHHSKIYQGTFEAFQTALEKWSVKKDL